MALPPQTPITTENNFIGGLKTESTGLNFPENACTSTENCVFSLIGDVFRRNGIDFETNFTNGVLADRTNLAINSFVWENAGGDGNTKILVQQIGITLFFYVITNATLAKPLSTTRLNSTVSTNNFLPSSNVQDATIECQFASGNGYLFVYNPNCNPFYCTYSAGVVSAFPITIQIRDFAGIPEPGVADNYRPAVLSAEHQYNLQNQGWTQGAAWTASSTTLAIPTNANPITFTSGNTSFTVASGISGVSNGQAVVVSGYVLTRGIQVNVTAGGIVNSYSGTTLVINITSSSAASGTPGPGATESWTISPSNTGYISTWQSAVGNYPSNADQWWSFKNSSGVFSPSTTINNVTLSLGPAPKGAYILPAFIQQRTVVSGVAGLNDVSTTVRPKTGTWFQGRVWYAGVDASQAAVGDEPFYTWTENIYFSQIIVNTNNFGRCYQTNDPTSETLANLLPSDGGVITIPGCGSIYKLFPIQNGLLVFAANGIWFITGSVGIGFTATDYNIVKISGVKSISGTSFVDVNGLPMFWNEEGIYAIEPAKAGSGDRTNEQLSLTANPLTLGTILSFYNNIPLQSKKFARASYNPITYVIKWLYRSTNETDITSRYTYDSVINLNIANKAFYPYQVSGVPTLNGITYIDSPGGSAAPSPTFKYICSVNNGFLFAEENNTNYLDWQSYDNVGVNYTSFFITGYRLSGQAMAKFQPMYVKMYTRNLSPNNKYTIQALWNYANTGNSGNWSTQQIIQNFTNRFDNTHRRIKLRGHGEALQIKVSSVKGLPFDIIGWSVINDVDQGV